MLNAIWGTGVNISCWNFGLTKFIIEINTPELVRIEKNILFSKIKLERTGFHSISRAYISQAKPVRQIYRKLLIMKLIPRL